MVMTDEDYLFLEDFIAYGFGPVNEIVYQKYKYFGRVPILIDEDISIPSVNEVYIKQLYDLFKDYKASDLVNLSHQKGSPWYQIDQKYNSEIPNHVIISKLETKNWFNSIVEKENENESKN